MGEVCAKHTLTNWDCEGHWQEKLVSSMEDSELSEQRNCSVRQFSFPLKMVFQISQPSQDRVMRSYHYVGFQ